MPAQRGAVTPLMDAGRTEKLSTFVGLTGIAVDAAELAAVRQGMSTVAGTAKVAGYGTAGLGVALDLWAHQVDPRMTSARLGVNTGVTIGARLIGGVPGLALGAGCFAVDKLGPEPPNSMVVMDAHGKLSTVPWNYGGGWGGIAYHLHPDNYQWNLVMRSWLLEIGFVLPSDMGL